MTTGRINQANIRREGKDSLPLTRAAVRCASRVRYKSISYVFARTQTAKENSAACFVRPNDIVYYNVRKRNSTFTPIFLKPFVVYLYFLCMYFVYFVFL